MTDITLTEQVVLPLGYTTRTATLADIPALTTLINTCLQAQDEPIVLTEEDLHDDYTMSGFDLSRQSQLVVAPDGSLAGFIIVWMRINPPVHPWFDWQAHPAHDELLLSRYLLQQGEAIAQTAIERCPPHARVAWRSGTKAGYIPYEQALYLSGATLNRHFYRMLIELETAPTAPILPAHIRIRTYNHPDELNAVIATRIAAFRDHFGYIDRPLEVVAQEWSEGIQRDKQFDPTLHFLAEDTTNGQIAGISLCRWEEWGNTDGYVKTLGVRREYRKQGIAQALLQHTFQVFWERGKRRVALHVDATNPTGALRLYERAGMQVDAHYTDYEKELRGGEELSNLAE